MDRFHIIDDAAVILRTKGVYRQAKVFVRAGGIYAAHGVGFIRLYKGGGTGLPTVSWDDIDLIDWAPEQMQVDALGKLSVPPTVKVIGHKK